MSVTKRRGRRLATLALSGVLCTALLTACGEDGTPTLTWYVNPDGVDTLTTLAEGCSTDDYRIELQELPSGATDQRTQLARRLAAEDDSLDLMSLDPVFIPEFASAGWLAPLPEELAQQATDADVLEGAAATVEWDDEVVAFPQWANTQLLWYRRSLAEAAGLDMSKPVTWEQIISAASDQGGSVGVQANRYEGYVVWINALILGAGGAIVENTEAGTDAEVTIDSDAGRAAAQVIADLAASPAAQSDLSVSNEGTSLGLMYPEGGPGEFMVNWTFIYKNYEGLTGQPGGPADQAGFEDLGWARYPQTVAGQESAPPIGGIQIGVGAYSEYPDYAMAAANCVTTVDAQVQLAVNNGLMPSRASAYDDPGLQEAFPPDLLDLFRTSIDTAGPRPQSAYYSKISGAVQSTWHPADQVDPETTPGDSAEFLADVLAGEALL
ncbi:extracellular solute-binding protein [Nocardioides insulae]|uniref:extracellular solute-binding protein n=1 Tax=Nocardioides insulae TaxID=394734 RepID=UPI00056B58E8|nr:extracellular solute-binding protein [Nocardioides insulae]